MTDEQTAVVKKIITTQSEVTPTHWDYGCALLGRSGVFCATARQRAEAFLRTVGKWKQCLNTELNTELNTK